MKKGKLLSILTSIAMTGSMVASAMPFTASAAANPLGLQLTSEKTAYTMDEIRQGATATVYVDPIGSVSEADKVGSVVFSLKSDAWGKVDPINLKLSDPNALATNNGNKLKADKPINGAASMVISNWDDEEKPKKAGFAINDYSTIPGFTGYSDDYLPAVIMMSDSSNGFFRTASDGEHIAEFKVKFPTDLQAGKYTISFAEAQSMICVDGKFGSDSSVNVDSPQAKSITFEIGAAASTSATTRDPNIEPDRIYDGSCTIDIKKAEGDVGETVEVPVYLSLGSDVDPKYITGVAFKVNYDKTQLELQRILDPDDSGLSEGGFNQNPTTGVFLYNFTNANITVDPTLPICLLKFKIKEGAKGEIPISLTNHLNDNWTIQVIHTQEPLKEATYLRPTVNNGAVVVKSKVATKLYDGDAYLRGEQKVPGTVGQQVEVPVYLDLDPNVNPKYITGIAFKVEYDQSMLKLDRIIEPDDSGLSEGGFNQNPNTGVFLYNFTNANITVDPNYPICVLRFTVKDGATGEIPINFVNHLFEGEPLQIIHTQEPLKDATYLTPHVTKGSVLVQEATTTTTEQQTEVVTSISVVESVSVVTSISQVTSIEPVQSVEVVTSIEPVQSIVTSIEPVQSIVTSIEPVQSVEVVTSIEPVQSVEVVTSIEPVQSVDVVTSIEPVQSVEVVTSIEPVQSVDVVTSIEPVQSVEVVTSIDVVTSVEVVTSLDVVTSISPVESVTVVTSYLPEVSYLVTISEVTVEPIISVSVSEVTVIVTTTSTSASETEKSETSISFSIPGITDDDSQWYYADETDWHLDSVRVFIDGEEVTDYNTEDLIITLDGVEATPQSVYNGKDFDYTITISFMETDDTFQAKIGQRGDANCDHQTNVRDAAAIAKDLANLYKTKKTSLTKENGFGVFLGNSDQGRSEKTPAYAPYDLNVRDAAVIAKYLANKKANPNKILKDYVKIAK